RLAVLGAGLVAGGIILMALGAAFSAGHGWLPGQAPPSSFGPGGMMGFGAGNVGSGPAPGSPGFVAGTTSAPRVVRITASDALRFYPDVVIVKQGETMRFEVTTMGMRSHEFMVGPAADVAADKAGTPEVADIAMMQTKSLTYTVNGTGTFAFACHEPGHYEAGMRGTIVVVP
ncbi:MAG: plastocyanin/azurin family copper-binding protein, partial [Candidatus Dormibacteria bacterium]